MTRDHNSTLNDGPGYNSTFNHNPGSPFNAKWWQVLFGNREYSCRLKLQKYADIGEDYENGYQLAAKAKLPVVIYNYTGRIIIQRI